MDENLTWTKHIQYICTKIAQNIGIITKAWKILNTKIVLMLYYCFIYPYINYAITVWGTANVTVLDPLIKLQKKAVRLVSNVSKYTHTAPLFSKNAILTVNSLYIINVGSFMHSFLNGKLSKTFNSMFKINYNVHSYGTRQAALFHTPVGRTAFSYKTIKFKGVSIYNNISTKINTTCSIAALKAQLKQLLLRGDTF